MGIPSRAHNFFCPNRETLHWRARSAGRCSSRMHPHWPCLPAACVLLQISYFLLHGWACRKFFSRFCEVGFGWNTITLIIKFVLGYVQARLQTNLFLFQQFHCFTSNASSSCIQNLARGTGDNGSHTRLVVETIRQIDRSHYQMRAATLDTVQSQCNVVELHANSPDRTRPIKFLVTFKLIFSAAKDDSTRQRRS